MSQNNKIQEDIKETSQEKHEKTKLKKPVLGRGLGALLPNIEFSDRGFKITSDDGSQSSKTNFAMIELTKIVQNPYQPRKEFDRHALEDLMKSIITNGVIQPITVRRSINGYELISGERRHKASLMAGLEKIPAYILDVESDVMMLELALIENLQREDLNPIETANGYQRLIEECNLTQEQVAVKMGKDRSTVTNFLRLLRLPDKIQDSLRKREISMGHARALLGLNESNKMINAWQEIMENDLSVRGTETLVKKIIAEKIIIGNENLKRQDEDNRKDGKAHVDRETALVLRDYENKLRQLFSTQVKITTKSNESGTLHIDFYSKGDFDRLFEIFNFLKSKMD